MVKQEDNQEQLLKMVDVVYHVLAIKLDFQYLFHQFHPESAHSDPLKKRTELKQNEIICMHNISDIIAQM